MKKFLSLFILPLAVFAISCQREVDSPNENNPSKEKKMVFTDAGVSLSPQAMDGKGSSQQEQTKSYLTIAVEDIFDGAALFAFKKSTGEIICYEDGSPVTLTTTEKTFSWRLPLNVDMKVYTLVNYKGNITADIASMLQNPNLKTTDLEAISFSCESGTALKEMETKGYGLPMAGITECTLTPTNSNLNLTPKRLFAKYLVYFDKSELVNAGYEVNSLYISASRSNTVVPVFTEGYGQTDPSFLKPVDLGSGSDLIELNMASKEHAVALYFLENCQGNMGNLSNWYEVANAPANVIPRKNLCSYIDLGIKASTAEGDQNFIYWVFLGDDCKTNFDIRRNTTRYLKIRLHTPDVVPPTQGLLIAGEPNSVVNAQYPNNGSLYFETSLPQDQILLEKSVTGGSAEDVSVSIASFGENEKQLTAYAYSGYITVHPEANKNFSTKLTAGKKNGTQWIVSGEKIVTFTEQDVVVGYDYKDVAVSISANPTTIAAAGGTSTLTAGATYKRQAIYKSGNRGEWESMNGTPTISGSATGFTRDNLSVTVAANTGYTSRSVTYKADFTIEGHAATQQSVTITQNGQEDTIDHYNYKDVSVSISANPTTISASGGSSTLSYSASYSRQAVYKSGATGNWESQSGTPTISGSATGFSRSGKNVTVEANPNYTSRSVTYRANFSVGGSSATEKSVTITQSAQSDSFDHYEYRNASVSISASPTTISASGGSSTLSYSASYQRRSVNKSGATGNWENQSGTPTITGSATGFTRNGTSVTVSANSSYTSSRSVTYTASFSVGSGSYSSTATQKSVTITQSAKDDAFDHYDYSNVSVSISASPTTISAAGGSSTLSYSASYTETPVYKSGKTGTAVNKSGTPTISGSATGFTRSGTSVTVASNTGNSRSVTYTANFTIGSKSATAKSVTITQNADAIDHYNYSEVSVSISANPTTIGAAGGSSTLSYSASYKQTPVYVSGKTGTATTQSGTPTISGSATGFTRNGTSVTVAANTSTSPRSVTYTANFSVGSVSATQKSVTITQNGDSIYGYEYSDASVSISASPTKIPAAGGSSTLSYSASYKKRAVYASGNKGSWETLSGTPTINGSATGFTRNGTSVTVSENPSYENNRSVTYTANFSIEGQTATEKSVTITQNHKEYKEGFEWIDGSISLDAGSSKTVSYRYTGSYNLTRSNDGLQIVLITDKGAGSNGYQYTGTATVTANGGMSAGNYSVTGTSGGKSASMSVQVTKPDVFDHYVYENMALSITSSLGNESLSPDANSYTVTISQATATRYEYWTVSGKKTSTATQVSGTATLSTSGNSAFTQLSGTKSGTQSCSVSFNSGQNMRSVTYSASYTFATGYSISRSVSVYQLGLVFSCSPTSFSWTHDEAISSTKKYSYIDVNSSSGSITVEVVGSSYLKASISGYTISIWWYGAPSSSASGTVRVKLNGNLMESISCSKASKPGSGGGDEEEEEDPLP